ncbi:hypothetical protein F442_20512 [Phytophthora nicotianae P10297]|uniref:Uncharacterized protein n=1 Tax=Phytophthora nicotianae P10297 TaxID=1317064 RepID=W2Y690_PHYNI|nr:hypothetical protein F442_20512 [Phytophthora nicotianae P10297]
MAEGFLPKKQTTHPMVVPSPLLEQGRQTQTGNAGTISSSSC